MRFRNLGCPFLTATIPVGRTLTNQAWVAVDTAFEVQIDELARARGLGQHRTGAIYDIARGSGPGRQLYGGSNPIATQAFWESRLTRGGLSFVTSASRSS